MHFKGNVTDIDLEFSKFVVDEKVTIQAGLLLALNKNQSIPALNSIVKVCDGQLYNNTIFLNSSSSISASKFCSKDDRQKTEPFLEVIKNLNLNFFDITYLQNVIITLKKVDIFSTKFLEMRNIRQNIQINDLVLKAVSLLVPKIHYKSLFDESVLESFKIFTPKDHKLENGAKEIVCKMYWSHGVQSFKNNTGLIGLLRVSNDKGFIILEDANYFIVCQIAPDKKHEYSLKMSIVLNNFVMIKNYHILLERTSDNPMIHYIFVNIRDIHLLVSVNQGIESNFGAGTSKDKITVVKLKVLHRCTVSVKRQYLNCWIHCEIKTPNCKIFRECFFILNGKHFSKYPLMNPDDQYILISRLKAFEIQMTEFKSIKNYTVNGTSLPVFWIPKDAKLTLVSGSTNDAVSAISNDFSLMSVPEINQVLEMHKKSHAEQIQMNTNELLNFEGVIKKRRTVSPMRNAPKSVDHKCFGVRGTAVHHIIFKPLEETENPFEITRERAEILRRQRRQIKVYGGQNLELAERYYQANLGPKVSEEETISLYLHNWQELQLPLGIVEGMKVTVRNVMIPKGTKYVRPTFLTQIEPVSYHPEQEYQNAFEFLNNYDWGPPSSLSDSLGVPVGTVCWCPIRTLHFTALTICVRCPICNKPYFPGQFICCDRRISNLHELKPDVMFGVSGRDTSGCFDAVSRDDELLRRVLRFREIEWKHLKRAYILTKWWDMRPNQWEEEQRENVFAHRSLQEDLLAQILIAKIKSFNQHGFCSLDIKARKLEKNYNEPGLNSKWYIVDVRPSISNTK